MMLLQIMNKNKHCLLDVTPHSVEKLQYAQYCPIVIYINVDSRSRLKELRKNHSKTAATKSSRKLMEDSLKIQKSYNYLFTGKRNYDSFLMFGKFLCFMFFVFYFSFSYTGRKSRK